MPVLAICRGMQLVNCRLNGSLLNDIETIRGVNHRKINDSEDRYHNINIKEGTLLKEVVALSNGKLTAHITRGLIGLVKAS
jgi:putative glutamine amidotransferase